MQDIRCKGCEYNTPKTRGGLGRLCNGYTMTKLGRCPEWAINERRKEKEAQKK